MLDGDFDLVYHRCVLDDDFDLVYHRCLLDGDFDLVYHRCLLDVYLEQREVEGLPEEDKKEGEKEKEGKEEGEGGMVSPMTTKILSLISYLLSQPGIKSAILQLISAG